MHPVPFVASRSVLAGATVLAAVLLPETGLAQQTQHHLYTFRGDAAGDAFGFAVTGVGDLDKDFRDEVCVGAEAANSQTGYIRVFAGATGTILATVSGTASGDRFGYAVRNAGDVNNDGFPDIVVGAPGQSATAGYVKVLSGLWVLSQAGTQVLHTFQGKAAGDEYGFSVSDAGDVDQDGHADVLIGARQRGLGSGYAEVRSGKSGNILFTYAGGTGFNNFGRSVSNAGDPNKDGYPDAIIGGAFLWRVMSGKDGSQIRQTQNQGGKSVSGTDDVNLDGYDDVIVQDGNTSAPKAARVFSGKDWTVLYTLNAGSSSVETTFTSRAGDVNQDGHPDVIVHNAGNTTYPVSVYSGKDGTPLLVFQVPGVSVSGAGDANGDGVPDVLVGHPGSATTFGMVHVFSGAKLGLASDTHAVSIAQGGTQALSLDAGTTHANRPYWIFGSITGTSPGITLLGVKIPLNPDLYTDLAISSVGANPPFKDFRGTLDASGTASAALIVPTGLPPIPFTLFHAFVVYDAKGKFHMASNAVHLNLTN